MNDLEKEDRYLRARERVEAIRKFYGGIATYVFVVAVLAGVNYYKNKFSHPWVLWVDGFWGLGIFFQGVRIYGKNALFGKDWEERKIKEFMKEDERGKSNSRWE